MFYVLDAVRILFPENVQGKVFIGLVGVYMLRACHYSSVLMVVRGDYIVLLIQGPESQPDGIILPQASSNSSQLIEPVIIVLLYLAAVRRSGALENL